MKKEYLLDIIRSELKPSLGCTEPVAVGLAVSNTVSELQEPAQKLELLVSSNIFKNAYCVKIPKTTSSGIYIAAALGYLLAKKNNTMEIFDAITPEIEQEAKELLKKDFITIKVLKSQRVMIEVTALNDHEKVVTKTYDKHDNLVYLEKNDEVLVDNALEESEKENLEQIIIGASITDIIETAMKMDVKELEFLKEAIDMNLKASDEGLKNDYGLRIGKTTKKLMDEGVLSNDLTGYVRMRTAAASDCRMGGGPKAAMTILGSGNQGFENTLPVAAACEYLSLGEDVLLKAEAIAISVAVYIKYNVGRLSPICGAVFTGAGSAAGICYLLGGDIEQMRGSVFNMLGNLTGMICDGAKDGCALKLASSAQEAVSSALLALNGSIIQPTDGIISERLEDTVQNVCKLSQEAMQDVDMDVIHIMLNKK